MKTVEIGDGSKVVDMPSHWHVETDDDGTVLAHVPEKDFVNVRISIVTLVTEDPERRKTFGYNLVEKEARDEGHSLEVVDDKCFFSYEEDSEEDGEALKLRFWHIGYGSSTIVMSTCTIKHMATRPEVRPFIAQCERMIATIRSVEPRARTDGQ